nr:PREDICTED: uncharacterized protein LOC105263181 [Fopius arisanus]
MSTSESVGSSREGPEISTQALTTPISSATQSSPEENISTTLATSIITEETFGTEKTEGENGDYETEIETKGEAPEGLEYEEEIGLKNLTDYFEYSEEGSTMRWGTSARPEVTHSSDTSTQTSRETTLGSWKTSSSLEVIPENVGMRGQTTQTSRATSESLPSSEIVLEVSKATSTTAGLQETSEPFLTVSEFVSGTSATSELFQNSETTPGPLTILESSSEASGTILEVSTAFLPTFEVFQSSSTTSETLLPWESTSEATALVFQISSSPPVASELFQSTETAYGRITDLKMSASASESTPSTPGVSTSSFPWETRGPTEQLTSIITEYESTPSGITLEYEGGTSLTQSTTGGLISGTKNFDWPEVFPDLEEGSTTPGFGEKPFKVSTTTEFVLNVSMPKFLERPETPSEDYPDKISKAKSQTLLPQELTIENQLSLTTSFERLDTSPEFYSGTEVLLSSFFPGVSSMPLTKPEVVFPSETTQLKPEEETESTASWSSSTEESAESSEGTAKSEDVEEEEVSSGSSERTNETPGQLIEDEETLKDEENEQLERRKKLRKKMKELEEKQKALQDREAEFRRRQEEWEREKLNRQREKARLEEEKRKTTTTIRTTTTEIPTTTIDYAKLEKLEEMKRKQEELNDELERMEKEIVEKEKELEEMETTLAEEERKYEQEKEEFEKMWNEEEEVEEREKELAEKKKELKDKAEELEQKEESSSTEDELESTSEKSWSMSEEFSPSERLSSPEDKSLTSRRALSTEIPPTESTLSSSSTPKTTSASSTPLQLPETSLRRGEGDDELKEPSDDYVFDKNEEVWKEQQPSDSDRKTTEDYEEGCSSPKATVAPISRAPQEDVEESKKEGKLEESKVAELPEESSTKKVCLHVLDADSPSGTVDPGRYVTKLMCLPNFRGLHHRWGRSRDNSRRRRLMNAEETSTVPMNRIDLQKRSKDVVHEFKIKPIASLDLVHGEWLHNDTTMPLHTPVGFTRVYESWSKVPFQPFTFMEDFTRKGYPIRDETFMRKHFKLNKFEQRVQPTQVNRLANDEWKEISVRPRVGGTTGIDEEGEQSDVENEGENRGDDDTRDQRRRRVREDSGRPTEFPPAYEENCLLQQHGRWRSDSPDHEDSEDEEEDRNDENQVFVEPETARESDDLDDDAESEKDERTIAPDNDDHSGDARSKDEPVNADESPSDGEEKPENQGESPPQNEKELKAHDKKISGDAQNEEISDKKNQGHSDDFRDEEGNSEANPPTVPKNEEESSSLTPSSSSKSSHRRETTQSLLETSTADYGDIEYVTSEDIESFESSDEDDEAIPENGWQDYESSDESERDLQKREGKLLSSLKSLIHTKELLMNKKRSLLQREDLLKQKKKLLEQSKADLEQRKAKRSKRKTGRNSKPVTSWPTEGTGRYHLGGHDKWDSGLLEDVPQDFKKEKQAFTVNVLRLDYDEEEENHKLKCEEPGKEDLVVNQGLVTRKTEETTLKRTSWSSESTTKQFKLYYDPNSEAEVVADEKSLDAAVDKGLGKRGKGSVKTTKARNPPGTEWPTEKTMDYHVGGTKFWDKEVTGNPNGQSYRRRNIRAMDYSDDAGEEEEEEEVTDDFGTTCYTLLLKKEDAAALTQKRSVEEQIQEPEDVDDDYDEGLKLRLRTIKSITQLTREESPSSSHGQFRRSENLPIVDESISSESITQVKQRKNERQENLPQHLPETPVQDLKNLPLLIRMNSSKIIRMAGLDRPPKELYVMYKCGPPEIVAVFDPKSENSMDNFQNLGTLPTAIGAMKDYQNIKGHCKGSEHPEASSTSPKYKTIFPFNPNQVSEATIASIQAHIHGELNTSSNLSKRSSRKKKRRRKGKRKGHKRRRKPHRHRKRRILSVTEELIPEIPNSSYLFTIAHREEPHEGIGRSLLALKSSKRKAKFLKHNKKPRPTGKPKKKSKRREAKKVHKRETTSKIISKTPGHSGSTPQLMNRVFSIIRTPKETSQHRNQKSPRSIIDTMKQVINNVIGHNSTTPEPQVNINPDDEDVEGGYTEIVHQSAGKFMPKDDFSSDRDEDERHHRKKTHHHHHPSHHLHHHRQHHNHHHDHKTNHLKKNHSKYHHHEKPSRETRVRLSRPKMAPTPLVKHNLSPLTISQGEQKSLNISSIIPTVKNLVENQNLGSLEKIIVYVDKTEGFKKKKRTAGRFPAKITSKFHDEEKKEGKRSKAVDKNPNEVYFDGASLDDMISHVADKIITSVSGSSLHELDPHLNVKVIQEVPSGSGSPHEETKSEFSIDLTDVNLGKSKKSLKKDISRSSKISSSTRLTSGSGKRKMNLKEAPGKKRNLWKSKIKRENIVEVIRKKLEGVLKKKLSRTRRKAAAQSLEDSEQPLPHHLDDLDEKIRILYAMHHGKEEKEGEDKKKKKRGQKNRKRSKREDDWRLDYLESNIFATENDKKSLKGLIEQIMDLQKNVNTTLQIIRRRLDESSNILARNLTHGMVTDSSSSTTIQERSIPTKKTDKQKLKKTEKKKTDKTKSKKKPTPKPSKKITKPEKKKSQKPKTKDSKKKPETNYGDEQVDKIGNEIQEILKEEGDGKIAEFISGR